jgi:hypothetical protein
MVGAREAARDPNATSCTGSAQNAPGTDETL